MNAKRIDYTIARDMFRLLMRLDLYRPTGRVTDYFIALTGMIGRFHDKQK